jgi:ATP-dependent Lon protease
VSHGWSVADGSSGIKTIVIPKLNEKDILDLPDEVRQRKATSI